ncbi:hypothetical protein [Vibrio phage PJN101]|nr:hypothetical protein [Vibrio phage PJN101]
MANIRYEVRESMPNAKALIIVSTDHNGAQKALYCSNDFYQKDSVELCAKHWLETSWAPIVQLRTGEVLMAGTLEECIKYARTARILD